MKTSFNFTIYSQPQQRQMQLKFQLNSGWSNGINIHRHTICGVNRPSLEWKEWACPDSPSARPADHWWTYKKSEWSSDDGEFIPRKPISTGAGLCPSTIFLKSRTSLAIQSLKCDHLGVFQIWGAQLLQSTMSSSTHVHPQFRDFQTAQVKQSERRFVEHKTTFLIWNTWITGIFHLMEHDKSFAWKAVWTSAVPIDGKYKCYK